MTRLIILLLVILNPGLILDTPERIAIDQDSNTLQITENKPRLINNSTTISWIKSHQKEDGGYGRIDSSWSHGSWTYAAVYALTLLDKTRKDDQASPDNLYNTMLYVQSLGTGYGYRILRQTHHPAFENVYTLNLLGYESFNKFSIIQDLSGVNLTSLGITDWRYRSIEEIYYTVATLKLLGSTEMVNMGDVEGLVSWLKMRQNHDGGWDNIGPDNDPYNLDSTSYVTHTWYASMVLSYLNISIPNNESLVKFVQSCQNPDGGFGNRPVGLGSSSDVYYMFAAVQTLEIFGKKPHDVNGAIMWLNRLQNYDGGFGDKAQWNSRLYATYYTIHSLIILNGTIFEKIRYPPKSNPIPATHHVFSFGMEVGGYSDSYSSESVLIAEDLDLDLIGIKTTNLLYSIRANEFADYYNLSTRTILSPEYYAEKMDINGIGRFTHVADILYPPDSNPGLGGTLEWQEYKNRIKQGHNGGALFFIGPHARDFDYLIIDDSLNPHDGYDLIHGGSGHGETIRRFPWFERWIGKIPMVVNTDAHREFWELRGHHLKVRTLYIASNSTWEGFKEAVLKNNIVIVFKTEDKPEFSDVVFYGTTEAVQFVQEHADEWIWWDARHSKSEIQITPITHGSPIVPDNSYEWDVGNFSGVILRLKTTNQILSVKLDDQPLNNLIFVDRSEFFSLSSFYYVHLENISDGTHVVEAEYKTKDGLNHIKTLIFDTGYPSLYLQELTHFPSSPTDKDPIIVEVDVIERIPVKHIILWYSIDNKATWHSSIMRKNKNSTYSALIGKIEHDKSVYYYIEIVDNANNSIKFPYNEMDYASFVVSFKRSPKEYTYIFIFSVIPIVSIVGLLAEIQWNRKARKRS